MTLSYSCSGTNVHVGKHSSTLSPLPSLHQCGTALRHAVALGSSSHPCKAATCETIQPCASMFIRIFHFLKPHQDAVTDSPSKFLGIIFHLTEKELWDFPCRVQLTLSGPVPAAWALLSPVRPSAPSAAFACFPLGILSHILWFMLTYVSLVHQIWSLHMCFLRPCCSWVFSQKRRNCPLYFKARI